jgi:hypothetical protein
MQYFDPNWQPVPGHTAGRPIITDPNSAAYGKSGIDWGKFRINFGYGDVKDEYIQEDSENVVYLEQPEEDNTLMYIAAGLAGLVGLFFIFRR